MIDFLMHLTWPQAAVCIAAMVIAYAILQGD